MLDIIPNWHPIFVHFTVTLFSLAVGLYAVAHFMKPPVKEQWQIMARWALWFGAGFTVITGLTGLYAYNTVAHDAPSHAAMTDHRNWAVVMIILFAALTTWSVILLRKKKAFGTVFIVCMLTAGGVLASTAWHGGEVVYRYGLGVMSLPNADDGAGGGHAHSGGQGHGGNASKTILSHHQNIDEDGHHDAMNVH